MQDSSLNAVYTKQRKTPLSQEGSSDAVHGDINRILFSEARSMHLPALQHEVRVLLGAISFSRSDLERNATLLTQFSSLVSVQYMPQLVGEYAESIRSLIADIQENIRFLLQYSRDSQSLGGSASMAAHACDSILLELSSQLEVVASLEIASPTIRDIMHAARRPLFVAIAVAGSWLTAESGVEIAQNSFLSESRSAQNIEDEETNAAQETEENLADDEEIGLSELEELSEEDLSKLPGYEKNPFDSDVSPESMFDQEDEQQSKINSDIPQQKLVAQISDSSEELQQSTFWEFGRYHLSHDNRVIRHPLSVTFTENNPHGSVSLVPMSFSTPRTIPIPSPEGFAAGSLHVEGTTAYRFHPTTQQLQLLEPVQGVQIDYKVYKASGREYSGELGHAPLHFSKRTGEVVELLRAEPDEKKRHTILHNHLRECDYVLSKQIQNLLDMMLGHPIAKTSHLRIGDCDTLSVYVMALLREAGYSSQMPVGLICEGDTLSTHTSHAMVDTGDLPLFESTLHTRTVDNEEVELTKEDYATLLRIVRSMSVHDSEEELTQKYALFREVLDDIFEQTEESEEGDAEQVEEDSIKDILKDAVQNLIRYARELLERCGLSKDESAAALFVSALLAALAAALATLVKGYEFSVKKPRDILQTSTLQQVIASAKKVIGKPLDVGVEDASHVNSGDMYRFCPELEMVLPLSEFEQYSPKQQQFFERVVYIHKMMMDDSIHELLPFENIGGLIKSLLRSRRYRHILDRLQKEGVSIDTFLRDVHAALESKKNREKREGSFEDTLRDIMERAEQYLQPQRTVLENRQSIGGEMQIVQSPVLDSLAHRGGRRMRGGTTEFAGYRDYVPGDDPRYIDWNVWARTDRLRMKQFDDISVARCRATPLHVHVNLYDADDFDIEILAALLMAQSPEHYSRHSVESIRIFCGSQELEFLSKKDVQRIVRTASVSTFISSILSRSQELRQRPVNRKTGLGVPLGYRLDSCMRTIEYEDVIDRIPRPTHREHIYNCGTHMPIGIDRMQMCHYERFFDSSRMRNVLQGNGDAFGFTKNCPRPDLS